MADRTATSTPVISDPNHWFLSLAEKIFTPSSVNPITLIDPVKGEIF